MSIMDFFSSQGTAQPSPGSSKGNWKDWFLDMKGRKPFGRTISPDDDERGDWIEWFLNREGPAGRFRGSRRPRYDIDYLFNGGGSVQSGPRTREPSPAPNNSGVMAAMAGNPMVQQAKGFYEQIDPWIPNMDFGDRRLGFDFERPILGGTLGYGMDYDWDDENIGAYAKYVIGLGG